MSQKKDLWLRIKRYHFDDLVPPHLMDHVTAMFSGSDASTQAFAHKLGRKLHWSPKFAERAIAEYKKFVYLGNVGTTSVTPSKFIDMVWHEHLLFTKAYRVFCRDVIGQDFDHSPELVPHDKTTDKFKAQYIATLDAYQAEFGVAPPADIWDTAKFKSAVPKRNVDHRSAKHSTPDRWSDDTPLYTYFDSGSASSGSSDSSEATPEFGGGGGFSGAGAGRSWDSSDSTSSDSGHGHSDSGDSGSSDGGSDGGGSSCGSSCSSSCGGGGSD